LERAGKAAENKKGASRRPSLIGIVLQQNHPHSAANHLQLVFSQFNGFFEFFLNQLNDLFHGIPPRGLGFELFESLGLFPEKA
jgi:hypothetical protein